MRFLTHMKIGTTGGNLYNEYNRIERSGEELSYNSVSIKFRELTLKLTKALWGVREIKNAFERYGLGIDEFHDVFIATLIEFQDIQRCENSPFIVSLAIFTSGESQLFEEYIKSILLYKKMLNVEFNEAVKETVKTWDKALFVNMNRIFSK